jgi:hypothetical protein
MIAIKRTAVRACGGMFGLEVTRDRFVFSLCGRLVDERSDDGSAYERCTDDGIVTSWNCWDSAAMEGFF